MAELRDWRMRIIRGELLPRADVQRLIEALEAAHAQGTGLAAKVAELGYDVEKNR